MSASIIAAIDKQIASLQHAREILSGTVSVITAEVPAKPRGRPRGSQNAFSPAPSKVAKRTMSPATRARMAEEQKRRYAAKKKAE